MLRMREIKFRAWDNQEKKMHYDVQNASDMEPIGEDFCSFERILNVTMEDDYGEIENTRRFEVMQYIGKEDISKKEIYEGDIVKDDSSQLKGVVKFSERYLQFVVDDFIDGEQDYSEFMKDVEVIGNIFDNPELLEGSEWHT